MTRVLETRTDSNGLIHRRRRTETGRDFWTVEIPEAVYRAAKFVIEQRLPGWIRGEETRERSEKAAKLLLAGEKQEVVAEMTGMGRSAVAQLASRRQRKGLLPKRGQGRKL